jgi:DNA invertase Pin-like site-specific DNA recombinase
VAQDWEAMMIKRAALYVRALGSKSHEDEQVAILRNVASGRGWQVVKVYRDESSLRTKEGDHRPGLNALFASIGRSQFDVVMVSSVDRISRSLTGFFDVLRDLSRAKVDLYLHEQEIDTTTSDGRRIFEMCDVCTRIENAIVRGRVKAGMARARAGGKKLGRRSVGARKEADIIALRQFGMGIRKIARTVGVGISVVERVLKEAALAFAILVGSAPII